MVVTAKQMWLRLASTSDRVIPEDLLSLFARTGPEQLNHRHPPEPPDPPDPPDTTLTPSPSFTTTKTYTRLSTLASLPDPNGTRSGASRVGLRRCSSPGRPSARSPLSVNLSGANTVRLSTILSLSGRDPLAGDFILCSAGFTMRDLFAGVFSVYSAGSITSLRQSCVKLGIIGPIPSPSQSSASSSAPETA